MTLDDALEHLEETQAAQIRIAWAGQLVPSWVGGDVVTHAERAFEQERAAFLATWAPPGAPEPFANKFKNLLEMNTALVKKELARELLGGPYFEEQEDMFWEKYKTIRQAWLEAAARARAA